MLSTNSIDEAGPASGQNRWKSQALTLDPSPIGWERAWVRVTSVARVTTQVSAQPDPRWRPEQLLLFSECVAPPGDCGVNELNQ